VDSVRKLGIHIRAGVHTGKCEVIGKKLSGIAVHIGGRIGAIAAPDEVLAHQGRSATLRRVRAPI
jgi:class 3 adenylate cyclase